MDDCDYSVEICDRDWECFFEECEECNLLPPSLAGVESGMSDFDDTSSIFANIVQKCHPTRDFAEADCANDGPPECEGSPVDNYLSKHGLGGMESILSGSEEDIHLQSVNVFLERLRRDDEAEEFTQPRTQGGRARAEKQRDATQGEAYCAGGRPEHSLTFNPVSSKGETNVGQGIESLINRHNVKKTVARDEPCSNVVATFSNINPLLKDNQSPCFEVALIITEEDSTETKLNEATQSTQPCRSWNRVDTESQTAEAMKKGSTALDVAKQEQDSESSSLKRCVGASCSKQDVVTYERANDDLSVAEPEAGKPNKLASQDMSPSTAVKRKRRRKRRLSELAESVHGCEKKDSVKPSDSEEDQCACFTNELQKCLQSSATENFTASNCSGKVMDVRRNDLPYQILQRGMCKMTSLLENNITNGRTDTSNNSGNPTTLSDYSCMVQLVKSSHLDKCPAFQMTKAVCICSDSKQQCNAEVKSGCFSILPAAELDHCIVEVEQNQNLLATKTPVGEGTVISGELSNAMHQKQLQSRVFFKDQNGNSVENNHFSMPEVSTNGSDPGSANPEQMISPICSFSENSPLVVECAKSAEDTLESQPNKRLHKIISGQPKEHPETLSTWPKCKVMSQSDTTAEPRCPSDLTPVSSCCTVDTRSLTSLSNDSITEMSDSSCAPVSQTDLRAPRDKTSLKKHDEGDGHQSWSASNDAADLKCDVALKAEDFVALMEAESVPELVPDPKNSVFVMSSFWSEMEKLTINDILGLRLISGAAPDRRLPPLQENEPTEGLDWSDSGFFTQMDEPKPEGTHEDTNSIQNSMEDPSRNVNICADDIVRAPVIDSSLTVAPAAGLRKISKNVSVRNLPALEAGNHSWKRQTLQTQNEEEFEKIDDFVGTGISKETEEGGCFASSAEHSMSLSGIFDFIFGRRQSRSSPSATDDTSSSCSYGNSVPETYDHFFSEFDTESFFNPFIRASDQVKDELDPGFPRSSSANRHIQYPEVYDCFFASSSSDESSTESDEEENRGPVRVVTRFSRTSSASEFPTDIYDCFFTDKDLKQNFFWKNIFSFRNMNLNASRLKQQSLSNSLATVRPSVRPLQRTFLPVSSVGNQDVVFLDPALYPFEDRLFGQLSQQQFNFENLQMTLNPSKLNFT